jgi:triosephosphate isomerase
MTKAILIANWKNYPESLEKTSVIISGLSKRLALYKKLDFYIAPPLPYYESVSKKTRSFSQLAVQDMHILTKGSHTGSVSVDILKSFGVRLAILGHSERRAQGETCAQVSEKVHATIRSGMVPVVCVGERERDEEGEHLEFLRKQLKNSLEGIKRPQDISKLIVAYEPVWAIGKKAKDALSPEDLTQSVLFIRKALTDIFGRKSADRVPIVYGGSVEPANAENLFQGTGIKGFLVGHASLNPDSLAKIAQSLV